MFTLNRKQRIAFLLIADNEIEGIINPSKAPFRFILGGPGGTGKSHVYNAFKLFLNAIGRPYDFAFTAPTGVAAANIGGSTIYSELSLSTKYETLLNPRSQALPKLTERLSLLRGTFLDECFFFGCKEMERMSRNINLARGCNDDPFGYMDLILSGDEFQLPGPKTIPLYSHTFELLLTSSSSLQSLNEDTRKALVGFKNFRTFDKCIVLDTLVRQRDTRFVDLLQRLRKGACTTEGADNDLDYLSTFRLSSTGSQTAVPDVLKWISDPENASPLITYTNAVRDVHNWNMTKAFATASGQEFDVYYAEDTMGKGSERRILTGQNATDAWSTSIKANAHDLSGRLPLAIGMPIIIVDNIAVELGISNGSRGTIRGIKYFTRNARRYVVSIDVDLPGYTNPDIEAENPHRVSIPTVTKSIQFTSSSTGKSHTARRQQAPVIAGFAFTVHNSQSQSLRAATIHLESSVSSAASYVMLSRIQCGAEGPVGLRILGEVSAKQISTHASQEVRDEEKRLLALSERTIKEAVHTLSWYTRTGEEL